MDLQTEVVAAEDQVATDLAGEVVLLSMRTGMYYGLDEVGARVWQLVQEPIRVIDVRDVIMREYEVDQERCERDMLALLQELHGEGLVDVRDDAPLA